MTYGLIISAGKQSRFESEIPKALMSCGKCTLLDINIANLSVVCNKVYVVVSTNNSSWFDGYNKLVIDSGYGCGDAVMRALSLLPLASEDTVFIQWGDCLHKLMIYPQIKDTFTDKWIIPCVKEDNPYVQIIPDADRVRVHFSKYHELITPGFHDLSLFYGNAKEMLDKLTSFASKIKSDNETLYSHKHGNELQFLDVFNETDIKAEILDMVSYEDNSFNTVSQFNDLMNRNTIK